MENRGKQNRLGKAAAGHSTHMAWPWGSTVGAAAGSRLALYTSWPLVKAATPNSCVVHRAQGGWTPAAQEHTCSLPPGSALHYIKNQAIHGAGNSNPKTVPACVEGITFRAKCQSALVPIPVVLLSWVLPSRSLPPHQHGERHGRTGHLCAQGQAQQAWQVHQRTAGHPQQVAHQGDLQQAARVGGRLEPGATWPGSGRRGEGAPGPATARTAGTGNQPARSGYRRSTLNNRAGAAGSSVHASAHHEQRARACQHAAIHDEQAGRKGGQRNLRRQRMLPRSAPSSQGSCCRICRACCAWVEAPAHPLVCRNTQAHDAQIPQFT